MVNGVKSFREVNKDNSTVFCFVDPIDNIIHHQGSSRHCAMVGPKEQSKECPLSLYSLPLRFSTIEEGFISVTDAQETNFRRDALVGQK